MRTHYELLGIAVAAEPEEVKRAFRREIARYHPDKVHHLGPEFQEIAATRAAELTEAYRILMDPPARAAYDAAIAAGEPGRTSPAAARSGEAVPAEGFEPPPPSRPSPDEPVHTVPESLRQTQATLSVFVRKATIGRLRDIVEAMSGEVERVAPEGFDAAYLLKPRRGLFQKAEPPIQLLARVVATVDAAAVEEVWPQAARAASRDAMVCVFLLGLGVAPQRELAAAIAGQRRRNRQGVPPLVIPVDTRDWDPLLPPDTPSAVRKLLERLKLGV